MPIRTFPDLKTYLNETGETQERLAERLGITQSYMSKIVRNLQQPELKLALLIAKKTHVPLESLIRKQTADEPGISCV